MRERAVSIFFPTVLPESVFSKSILKTQRCEIPAFPLPPLNLSISSMDPATFTVVTTAGAAITTAALAP